MLVRITLAALLCSCGGSPGNSPGPASPTPQAGPNSAGDKATVAESVPSSGNQSESPSKGTTAPGEQPPTAPEQAPPAADIPVSYQLRADVAQGQTPQMRITALAVVSDLRLELKRNDGKSFNLKRGALARGGAVTVPVGDSAPGKASYRGTLSGTTAGKQWKHPVAFDTLVRAPLSVTYDYDHLDLGKRVLQFKLSRPAASAELVVIGDDGSKIGTGSASYGQSSPDTWLAIEWKQSANTRVMKMQLRAVSVGGLATKVELIPWSVAIDHEDVNFASDSSVIEPSEHKKLDASLDKIVKVVASSKRFMKVKLYIAGHTDTVGSAADNRALSQRRAQAIAQYLRKRGLNIAIAVAGFGEHVLKVDTPDNTDNRANRRADYVLGPDGGAPPFKGRYSAARSRWKLAP